MCSLAKHTLDRRLVCFVFCWARHTLEIERIQKQRKKNRDQMGDPKTTMTKLCPYKMILKHLDVFVVPSES